MANPFIEKNINFKVYMDGSHISNAMGTVTLPTITMMSDTLSGSGIAGEFDSPTIGHTQSITATMNLRKITDSHFQVLDGDFHIFDCRYTGQIKDGDSGANTIDKTSVLLKGTCSNINLGTIGPGQVQDASFDLSVAYIKVEYNGAVQLEISKMDMMHKVMKNGQLVDVLEETRSFLG